MRTSANRLYCQNGQYLQEAFQPPRVPDEHLFAWWRGRISEPYITAHDLTHSQDVRYAQMLLYWLARASHAKTIVEIGVAEGSTSWPLLKAASETGGMVYSVDPSPSSAQLAPALIQRNNLGDLWRFHNITSNEFFAPGGPGHNLTIEFAFIDGDHSYQGIRHDAENVFSRLIPGGFCVFHDLDERIPPTAIRDLPTDWSPESCSHAVARVVLDIQAEGRFAIDCLPISFGLCGLERFPEWTEGGVLITRKRLPGQADFGHQGRPRRRRGKGIPPLLPSPHSPPEQPVQPVETKPKVVFGEPLRPPPRFTYKPPPL
jgi:predicted O-methyltransferase YrrM